MSKQRIETYDLSPRAKEIVDYHYQRRLKLREEYLRECLKPIKQHLLVDSAVQRFYYLRILHEYRMRVTGRGSGVAFATVLGAIGGLTYVLYEIKENMENKIRTGQIAYADRDVRIM